MTDAEPYKRIRLRDDAQQWELDRAIKETGRVQHFYADGRKLPASVRTHDMISKHLARPAQRIERLAKAEAAVGHDFTAMELYYEASAAFAEAQHAILEDSEEKRLLHESSLRCYEQVRSLSATPIERIEIPWGESTIAGNLHLADTTEPAPVVFYIPGCDTTKEMAPHPSRNWATQRGMHLFAFDGPGQGESNLRGLKLTQTNYEEAASVAIDYLMTRPEIDGGRLGVFGMSFGSYWAARVAATDRRVSATVLQWATVCDKRYMFDGAVSPRYKQLFAYMTGARSEEELDEFIAGMGLDDLIPGITAPVLGTVGEYDPRSPLDEVVAFFDRLSAPWELWVYADQQHVLSFTPRSEQHTIAMDWLRDRLDGKPVERAGQVLYLEPQGKSPNDPEVPVKRHWYE